MTVTFQLAASAGRRYPTRSTTRSQSLEVEENCGRPGRAAAAGARQPHLRRGSPVRRRRHIRADDNVVIWWSLGPAGRRPVHLRRLRAVLAAAPGPRRVELVDRGLGAGRLVADEHRRHRAGNGRGRLTARSPTRSSAPTASRPPTATPTTTRPAHLPDGHTLFQRATDLQFLHGLARRSGKLCRVACTDTPGAAHRVLQSTVRRRPARRDAAR